MSTSSESEQTKSNSVKFDYYIDKSGCGRCGLKRTPLERVKYKSEMIWACEECLEEIEDEKKPIR